MFNMFIVVMASYLDCSDAFEEKHSTSTSVEENEDGVKDLVRHTMFEKGQSKRIWGELYKVIDSSDVVVQVGIAVTIYLVLGKGNRHCFLFFGPLVHACNASPSCLIDFSS